MSLYEIYNSKNITAPKNFPLHAVNFASVSCHPAPDSIYLKKLLFKNKNVFSYSFINQNEERNEKKRNILIYTYSFLARYFFLSFSQLVQFTFHFTSICRHLCIDLRNLKKYNRLRAAEIVRYSSNYTEFSNREQQAI